MRFTADVLLGIYKRIQLRQYSEVQAKYNVIVIDTETASMALSLTKAEKLAIIQRGYKITKDYIRESKP